MAFVLRAIDVQNVTDKPKIIRVENTIYLSSDTTLDMLFTIVSDIPCGPIMFLNCDLLPSYGSYYRYWWNGVLYEFDQRTVLLEKSVVSCDPVAEGGMVGVISCKFGPREKSKVPDEDMEETEPSSDDAFTLEMSLVEVEEPMKYDLDGRFVCNTAGDLFYDPVTRKRFEREYRIQRREYKNPENKAATYSNTLNNATFWGNPAGTLRLSITYSKDDSSFGWNVTYTIQTSGQGWNASVLNQGFFHKKVIDGQPQMSRSRILNQDGTPVDKPRNLASDGTLLGDQDAPVYVHYKRYQSSDYQMLNLPPLDGMK